MMDPIKLQSINLEVILNQWLGKMSEQKTFMVRLDND